MKRIKATLFEEVIRLYGMNIILLFCLCVAFSFPGESLFRVCSFEFRKRETEREGEGARERERERGRKRRKERK